MDDSLRLTDAELVALFRRLFPEGFAGSDVLAELAPAGWENSPLLRAFHPTLEQWHEERVAQHRRLEKLAQRWPGKRRKSAAARPARPEPTFEDSRRDFAENPIDAVVECTDVVGAVTWEIFAENHDVVATDGRGVDLGSWRAASSFLAELAEGRDPTEDWGRSDELRFYMGLAGIRGRCDYGAVYRLVFSRMQRETLDWAYSFPRLQVFRFHRSEDYAPHEYSPSEAFAREQQRTEDEAEHARLRAELDAAEREARAKAGLSLPPPVVQAYRQVFGRWPEGWPP